VINLLPILQFGQFLLAATTVFFAYESVRLRSVTTEQARRSAYFDDDEPVPSRPRMGRGEWGGDERFDDPQPLRRRIRSRADGAEDADEGGEQEDFYRPRRPERRAIPERAQSRFDEAESEPRGGSGRSRYGASREPRPEFGARRRERDANSSRRSGSRPSGAADDMPRSSRRPSSRPTTSRPDRSGSSMPEGAPISDADFSPISSRPAPSQPSNRDNSSRFDD
jgi:hypothetical protein